MSEEVYPTNSGKTSALIDITFSTHTAKRWRTTTAVSKSFQRPRKPITTGEYQNTILSLKENKENTRKKGFKTKPRCDNIAVLCMVFVTIVCISLANKCEGRLFENPHGGGGGGIFGAQQRGGPRGHGQQQPNTGRMGMFGRGLDNVQNKREGTKHLSEEDTRRRMLEEYGVDGVVDLQDIGPDGQRRKKIRLGPIVFDPEAIRFDDLDDYNDYPDGARNKIGIDDYESDLDDIDRDRLIPSRNGGGLNIINKLMVSLFNFGSSLYKVFGNLYRHMAKQAKFLIDRFTTDGDHSPSTKSPIRTDDVNKGDHGETSLTVIVVASWLIFGIIVALVTYVVNYWSDVVVGDCDSEHAKRKSADEDHGDEVKEEKDSLQSEAFAEIGKITVIH